MLTAYSLCNLSVQTEFKQFYEKVNHPIPAKYSYVHQYNQPDGQLNLYPKPK